MATFIAWSKEDGDPGDVSTGSHVYHVPAGFPHVAAEEWAAHLFHTREPFTSLEVCVRDESGRVHAYEVEVEAIPSFNVTKKDA